MQKSIKYDDVKTFSVRMPKDIWIFLKTASITKHLTMNDIIVDCMDKYRNRVEKKLTSKNT